MGKRKSKARVITKRAASVPTQFDCIFCNHAKTVECKLNTVTNVGAIKCRVCNVTFNMEINHLHDPIDVYSEWIDQTEKANRPADEADESNEEPRDRRRRDEDGDDGEDVGDDEPSRDRKYGRGKAEDDDVDDEAEEVDEDERRRARQRVKRERRVDDDVDEREDEEEAADADDGY